MFVVIDRRNEALRRKVIPSAMDVLLQGSNRKLKDILVAGLDQSVKLTLTLQKDITLRSFVGPWLLPHFGVSDRSCPSSFTFPAHESSGT
jgi:hypothetical protein